MVHAALVQPPELLLHAVRHEVDRATRIGGTLAMIGVLAGPANDLRLPLVVMQQLRLQGVTVGSLDDLEAMVAAIAQHRLRPVVEKVFPFAAARDAFRYMSEGRHFGKVAITLD